MSQDICRWQSGYGQRCMLETKIMYETKCVFVWNFCAWQNCYEPRCTYETKGKCVSNKIVFTHYNGKMVMSRGVCRKQNCVYEAKLCNGKMVMSRRRRRLIHSSRFTCHTVPHSTPQRHSVKTLPHSALHCVSNCSTLCHSVPHSTVPQCETLPSHTFLHWQCHTVPRAAAFPSYDWHVLDNPFLRVHNMCTNCKQHVYES